MRENEAKTTDERDIERKMKRAEKLVKKGKKRKRHVFRKLALSVFIFGLLCAIGLGVYIYQLGAWDAFDADKILNVHQTLFIYDKNNAVITGLHAKENRINVPLSQIPQHVQDALIATEDARFYEHPGVDVWRIFGALWEDLKSGSLDQGASTLSQQLIKLSHLTNDKTWTRKIQEAVMSIRLEQHFSKQEILEMYLNYVYFGNGAYGIEAAAQAYFSKGCEELTVSEGALLVGVLKAPTHYSPHIDLKASVNRRNVVLEQMEKNGYLSPEEHQAVKAEPIILELQEKGYPYGFYIDYAMDEAKALLNISTEELLSGGYRIETALDAELQAYCEEQFMDNTLFPPEAKDGSQVQGALVALDPVTNEITALLGGREHTVQRGFNRAAQLTRQPGSAIKPVIVYAPAIDRFGYTAASFVLDEKVDYNGYSPRNFSETFSGWVTLRDAVSRSLNIPAVRLLDDIGVESGKDFARSVGIEFDERDQNLSLALGGFTYGVTPLKLCGAYQPFAAKGLYGEPMCIRRITDADGNELYRHRPERKRVMSAENAYIVTSLLESVVSTGTGRRLGGVGLPLAGKTGTTGLAETGGNKDAWMVAYNPDVVVTLWMGFDDTDSEHALPAEATGGTYPAILLSRVFQHMYANAPAPVFERPENVREVKLDARTLSTRHEAVLANALTPADQVVREVFVDHTAPNQDTDYWVVPTPPGELKLSFSPGGLPVVSFMPKERFVLYRLYRDSPDGGTVLLGEYPGDNGQISTLDDSAVPGGVYEYYVVPVHPELTMQDQNIEGPESMRKAIHVPLGGVEDAVSVSGSGKDETLAQAQAGRPSPSPSVSPEPERYASPSSG